MNKRISRSLIILATAGLLGSGIAFAGNGPGDGSCDGPGDCTGQGGGGGNSQQARKNHGSPAGRMAAMANRLGLDHDQQVLALDLFELQAAERAEMKARIRADYGEPICDQRERHRNEFRLLLTDDQAAKLDEMQQKRANRGGRGGAGPDGIDCSIGG